MICRAARTCSLCGGQRGTVAVCKWTVDTACAGVQVCRCAGVQRLRFAIKMYSQLSATNKQTDKRTELTYFQYYTRQLEILKCAVQSTD